MMEVYTILFKFYIEKSAQSARQKISQNSMKQSYFSDQIFESTNFAQQPLDKGEYENCIFQNCNLEYADLQDSVLSTVNLSDVT